MYFEEGRLESALKCVSAAGEDLEMLAMQVQIYLKLDRLDLAEKACKQMAVLCFLHGVMWCNLLLCGVM
jgi:hypothetical protein